MDDRLAGAGQNNSLRFGPDGFFQLGVGVLQQGLALLQLFLVVVFSSMVCFPNLISSDPRMQRFYLEMYIQFGYLYTDGS